MGEGQSRLNQQHELYRAQLEEMRRQEALNEEQRRRQADELVAQTLATQKKAAKREEELRDSIRKIEEEQMKRAQEMSINSFHNELMQGYDDKIKEKNAELDSLRENALKELEALRKEQEEKSRGHLEDLNNIHQKIMKMDETHTETMKKLLEERNVERKEMQNEIIAANKQSNEAIFNMIKSSHETAAITFGILNNVIAKSAVEKDAMAINTKIDNMRQVLSKMEDLRRKLIEWKADYDLKKKDKGLGSLITRSSPEKGQPAQAFLKSMSAECSILDTLVKDTIDVVSKAVFAHDLTEKAKGALNFGLGKISDLFDEIAKMRVTVTNSPRTISFDVIKECLNSLNLAVNSVPSMVTQTTNEYIQEEMKKLEIKDHNFLTNAITANEEGKLAIEDPSY